MCGELKRYFIELQPVENEPVSRHKETEQRRALASQFLEIVGEWLREKDLIDKVSAMAITALGQVQITCEADVINHIRNHEDLNVAAIRQGAMLMEHPVRMHEGRWNEAR